MLAEYPFLSSLIWLPIIGGLLVTFFGERLGGHASKGFALIVSLATLLVSLVLWKYFEYSIGEMQFMETAAWIPQFGISYTLGVDGIALPLILLTTFTTVIVILAGWSVIKDRPGFYMGSFLLLEGLMVECLLHLM